MRTLTAMLAAVASIGPVSIAGAQCEIGIIQGPQGFGGRPAFQGDVLAVSRGVIVDGIPNGSVHIFRREDGEWALETILESLSPSGTWSAFGIPSVIDGDVLVAGDEFFPIDQPNDGAAFVYRHDGSKWKLEAMLIPPEVNTWPFISRFSRSLAINGDVVIAGASQHEVNGASKAGAAFIFRNGERGWEYEAMLAEPDATPHSHFGISSALAGDVALVGAHTNPGPGSATGAAFVFRFNGTEWVFEQKLKPPGDHPGQKWFGWHVALDAAAEIAAIGAIQDTSQNGAVYIFRYDGTEWVFEQKLMAQDPVGLAPFLGATVAIDAAGNVVVGAAGGDSGGGSEAGAAHVFRYEESEWNETMKILASDATAGAGFGHSAIWNDEAIMTAGGAAKAYHFVGILGHDCNDSGLSDACDIFFGHSTDSSGDGIPDECAADLNGDGKVGVADLLILLASWGKCPDCAPGSCPADLTGDCAVGVVDLLIVLENWG